MNNESYQFNIHELAKLECEVFKSKLLLKLTNTSINVSTEKYYYKNDSSGINEALRKEVGLNLLEK